MSPGSAGRLPASPRRGRDTLAPGLVHSNSNPPWVVKDQTGQVYHPAGGAWGNPVSPHPSPRAYVHISRPCRRAAHRPMKTGVWGNLVPPMFTLAIHAARAAQRRDEHTVVPGRAQPSQTLPRVGEWGNRVSPSPCGAGAWGNRVSPPPSSRAYVHVRHYAAAPHTDGMKKGSSWEGAARPNPPTGWGEWGNPVSPPPCLRAKPAQTLLRAGLRTPLPYFSDPWYNLALIQAWRCASRRGPSFFLFRRAPRAAQPGENSVERDDTRGGTRARASS